VALDLERDGIAVADVDDAGVLANACQHLAGRGLLRDFRELFEVNLGRFVGTVLAPHHRIHRQLGARRATAKDLADLGVLILFEAQFSPGLHAIRVVFSSGDSIDESLSGDRRTGLGGFRHTDNLVAASRKPRSDVRIGTIYTCIRWDPLSSAPIDDLSILIELRSEDSRDLKGPEPLAGREPQCPLARGPHARNHGGRLISGHHGEGFDADPAETVVSRDISSVARPVAMESTVIFPSNSRLWIEEVGYADEST
jgi:hypothetical protein